MKVNQAFVTLVALCVASYAPVTAREGTVNVWNDLLRRKLRQEGASLAPVAVPTAVSQDSTNPLRRRDLALVSSHRVYDPASGLACFLVGTCMACVESEKDESFCRETGYRQELACPLPVHHKNESVLATKPKEERQTRFKFCLPADSARPGLEVVKFEAVMTVLLAVCVVLLRRERGNYTSLLDQRKSPGHRAGPASSDKGSD